MLVRGLVITRILISGYAPNPVQEHKGERPFYPHVLAAPLNKQTDCIQ